MILFGIFFTLATNTALAEAKLTTSTEIQAAQAEFAACLNTIQRYFSAIANQDETALLAIMTPEMQNRSKHKGSFRSAFFGKSKEVETQHGKITYLGHRFVKIDVSKKKPMYKFEVLMGFEKNGQTVAKVEPIKFVFNGPLIDIAG